MADLLFKKVDYTIGKLLEDIALGEIGLPDIQRPFVWDTTRVRDLFDSMYRGYPIGTLLFWENGYPGDHWHDFLKVIKRAGYIHPDLITSQTALVYTYALWLIGKRDFGLGPHTLRNLMARWFFMSSLTGRYTGSPETRMDQDLALLRGRSGPEEFARVLEQEMAAVLTRDYWDVTLPNELATASAKSPGQAAFFASPCLLDAPVLYSSMKIRDLLDPTAQANKSALERHHLFPRKYLERQGVTDQRDINQVANYALVEWHDNIDISDRSPAEYAPQYEHRFPPEQLREMYWYHSLPEGWYAMDYPTFLEKRRRLMADVIQEGFKRLSRGHAAG
jgi:hypothetical protein